MEKADCGPASSDRRPRRADLPCQPSILASSHSSLPHQPSILASSHSSLPHQPSILASSHSSLPHQPSILASSHSSLPHQPSILASSHSSLPHQPSIIASSHSSLPHQPSFIASSHSSLPHQPSFIASSHSSLPHQPSMGRPTQLSHTRHLVGVVDLNGNPTSRPGQVWPLADTHIPAYTHIWPPADTHVWPLSASMKANVSKGENALGANMAETVYSWDNNPGLSTTNVAVKPTMAGAVTSADTHLGVDADTHLGVDAYTHLGVDADTHLGVDVPSELVNIHTQGQPLGETPHVSTNPNHSLQPQHVRQQDGLPAVAETERSRQLGKHSQQPARPMSETERSRQLGNHSQQPARPMSETERSRQLSKHSQQPALPMSEHKSPASTCAHPAPSCRTGSALSSRAASNTPSPVYSSETSRACSSEASRACSSEASWACSSASSAGPGSGARPRPDTSSRPLSTRGGGQANVSNNDVTLGGSPCASAGPGHTGRHIRAVSAGRHIRAVSAGRHIRAVSANLSDGQSQHYVLERLRMMYRARRASSATSRLTPSMPQSDTRMKRLEESGHRTSPSLPVQANISHLKPLDKFRHTVRLAVYLQRLMAAMIDNCNHRTMRSASELQWMTIYAENHDVTLAFNKHLYSRDRVSTHVPDWAVSVLGKSPEDRTSQDCRLLHALLRGMTNFDMFTGQVQVALCQAFTLDRIAEGRVVLKSGHVGRHFYLIYSGSVFVNLEDTARDGRKFMRTVSVLTRGQSFGELALLQDIRRTATVSVRERVELLTVDKSVFASVCPKIFERELAEKYSFLGTVDLFSAKYWSSESIRSLAMQAQIQDYKTNKLIVGNSLTEDWIYICMQGRCQVVRCLPLDQAPTDRQVARKPSDVVLSEEILQLLASTGGRPSHSELQHTGDMREQLLFSLGLDYVQTGKHQRLSAGGDQMKAAPNSHDTVTLTSFVKRQLDNNVKDFVILSLGVIEAGHVFDLPSLLSHHSVTTQSPLSHHSDTTRSPLSHHSDTTRSPLSHHSDSQTDSPLMLVSNGARVIRIRRAAFFDHASQQALENTRTLASKRRNPPSESILQSYKCSLTWDEFKSRLVRNILTLKQLRAQPIYRPSVSPVRDPASTARCFQDSVSPLRCSKIISALHSSPAVSKVMTSSSSSPEECPLLETRGGGDPVNQSARSTLGTGGSLYLESIRSLGQQETIMRRHPASSTNHVPVVRNQTKSLPATPKSRVRPLSAM